MKTLKVSALVHSLYAVTTESTFENTLETHEEHIRSTLDIKSLQRVLLRMCSPHTRPEAPDKISEKFSALIYLLYQVTME